VKEDSIVSAAAVTIHAMQDLQRRFAIDVAQIGSRFW
jgi:hypothetical protein